MKQHTDATLALRAINDSSSKCLGVGTIAGFHTSLTRTQADAAVRYLMARALVEHHKRGCYRITALGVQVAKSEAGVVKSKTGIAATATQKQTQGANGIRGAAWRALRITPNLTIDEILSRVDDGETDNARPRVLRYLAGLAAVNIITRKGKAHLLTNDLGPIAPTVGQRGQVFDPNAGVFVVGESE